MIHRPGKLFAIYLLSFTICGFSLFQPLVRKNETGNKNYHENNYEDALKSYTDALLESPESPELHYNIANVMYQQKKYKDAISEFEKTLSTDDQILQEKAYYNMGNCSFKEGEYDKAIDYYKKALEINPEDEDAKFNLEFTRQKLKEMMQNQQQQQQNQQQQQQQQSEQQQAQSSKGEERENSKDEKKQEQKGEREEDVSASPTPAAFASPTPETDGSEGESSKEAEEQEGITKEEAMNILRSMDDKEKENQKEMIKRMFPDRGRRVEKDW